MAKFLFRPFFSMSSSVIDCFAEAVCCCKAAYVKRIQRRGTDLPSRAQEER
jgi:hypothetical protein